jgi:predicted nucleotidyltransferase
VSKSLLQDTTFKSEIKRFFNKNKEVLLDIILFGSSVKGKEKPNDIDILLLYKSSKNIDVSYALKKTIEAKGYYIEITDKTYNELLNPNFIAGISIISEGYSLVYNKFLFEGLGYLSFNLFKYELKQFNKSERMRFYYSLYGRNNEKGMLKILNSIKFSDSIILCPVENVERMKEYFDTWKLKYVEFPILIPERIKNIL